MPGAYYPTCRREGLVRFLVELLPCRHVAGRASRCSCGLPGQLQGCPTQGTAALCCQSIQGNLLHTGSKASPLSVPFPVCYSPLTLSSVPEQIPLLISSLPPPTPIATAPACTSPQTCALCLLGSDLWASLPPLSPHLFPKVFLVEPSWLPSL